MRIDFSIDPAVNPAEAYRLVMNARGYIAAQLRWEARIRSEYNVWAAKTHKSVKRARDIRKHVRRMEMERMGWK